MINYKTKHIILAYHSFNLTERNWFCHETIVFDEQKIKFFEKQTLFGRLETKMFPVNYMILFIIVIIKFKFGN